MHTTPLLPLLLLSISPSLISVSALHNPLVRLPRSLHSHSHHNPEPELVNLTARRAASSSYGSVVSFGDSYSDNAHPRIDRLTDDMPKSPYFKGRYSNGPVFPEYVAASVAVGKRLYDYAYGAAHINNDETRRGAIIPDTKTQISTHLSDLRNSKIDLSSGRTLYLYLAGINTCSSIWVTLLKSSPSASSVPSSSLSLARQSAREVISQLTTIENLRTSSAKYRGKGWDYTILTIPPLDKLPGRIYMTTAGDEAGKKRQLKLLAAITEAFNEELVKGTKSFTSTAGKKSGAKVKGFNLTQRWLDYYNKPTSFGLDASNVGTPCVKGGKVCSSPKTRLYWDSVHPVTSIHQNIANSIVNLF